MAMGPEQIFVVGFGEDADFRGEALAELKDCLSRTLCDSSTC